jgi:hypothetical protein
MSIKYLVHNEIEDKDLQSVIDIKSIAWPYSVENQLQWIKNNISNEDVHVLLLDENDAVTAYLNMIAIDFEINGKKHSGFGVGNVCASEKGSGNGANLMREINRYFVENKKIGLLFCKEGLLGFYKKQGWYLIPDEKIAVEGINKHTHIMILNFNSDIEQLTYSGKIF